jgi:hypothetical protein
MHAYQSSRKEMKCVLLLLPSQAPLHAGLRELQQTAEIRPRSTIPLCSSTNPTATQCWPIYGGQMLCHAVSHLLLKKARSGLKIRKS